jgi:hypothetical protein
MSDDWRLRIDLHESGLARELTERLEATELEHDLESAFHDRVVVSRDGGEVFCYAGTREQAEAVERLVQKLAEEQGWEVETELRRWHPTAQQWEDPELPLPQNETEQAQEHAQRIQTERQEAQAQGYTGLEARVDLPSHAEAVSLAEVLRQEGLPVVQRWKYLLVGALDEDTANALADRLRREAPSGSTVTVEGTLGAVLGEEPENPFVLLGGLGG